MRLLSAGALGISVAIVVSALAPTVALSNPDYMPAYILSLRCFAAAAGEKDRVWSRRAFDAVLRLGHLQGFSNEQLNDAFEEVRNQETPRVARSLGGDHRYFDQLKADCRAIGLVD